MNYTARGNERGKVDTKQIRHFASVGVFLVHTIRLLDWRACEGGCLLFLANSIVIAIEPDLMLALAS